MMFKGLKSTCSSELEFLQKQREMGLDVVVNLPPRALQVVNDHYNLHGLPVRYDPRVQVKEWVEHPLEERWPLLVKEYHTPGGVLRTEVHQTPDWPWGKHVPFLDDYIIPRARKHLVTAARDLDALSYLLADLAAGDVEAFLNESQPYLEYARESGLLVSGGWGVGADLIGWICGLENMVYLAYDRPEFLRQLLDLIADWNRKRMDIVLSAGVDLYIKRAWYENCDFWTPRTWRTFIQPILQAEVKQAHQAGAAFGYLITSNAMPLIEAIIESGVDVIIGIDPLAYDLENLARLARGRICLWGGVNGHLTVEKGAPEEVRFEVRRALGELGAQGGLILSPVDNVREWSPEIERNVGGLIDEWQQLV